MGSTFNHVSCPYFRIAPCCVSKNYAICYEFSVLVGSFISCHQNRLPRVGSTPTNDATVLEYLPVRFNVLGNDFLIDRKAEHPTRHRGVRKAILRKPLE